MSNIMFLCLHSFLKRKNGRKVETQVNDICERFFLTNVVDKEFLSLLLTNDRSNEEENKTLNKVHQSNKRMFKHLLKEKDETIQRRIINSNEDNTGDDILETESDESDDNHLIIKPVYKNRNQTNLWENCFTENTAKDNQSVTTPVEHHTGLTDTEREVIKHRPTVSEIVKEITKASKKDMERRKEREIVENKARKIYEEILAVVHDSSPASLPVSRGVMVGCGQQGQDRNSKTRKNCRIRKKNTR